MASRAIQSLPVGLIGRFDDLLADRTPTTTDTPIRPTDTTEPDEENAVQAWYWVAGIVAVLGLTAAFVWGAVGTINALDRVDSFDRTAIPGAMIASVTDPGTMAVYYESPAELARYADPTATGQNATRWNPATNATIVVNYAANTQPGSNSG